MFGDITKSSCEVLVSSDDYMLSMGGGVSFALGNAAGAALRDDARKCGGRNLGEVVVTSAGRLPARYVLHAVTIGRGDGVVVPPEIVVRSATRRVMELLPMLGCSSVALPAIGTGSAGLPYEVVATEMAGALVEALLADLRGYRVEVYLSDRYGRGWESDFLDLLARLLDRRFAIRGDGQAGVATEDDQGEATRQRERLHLLRQLEARRYSLETQLMQALNEIGVLDPVHLAGLRAQLEEVNGLALQVEHGAGSGDAYSLEAEAGRAAARRVFVSSTSQDLLSHRAAVRGVLDGLGYNFVGMEDFGAESTAPAEMIRRRVLESEIYLGILGMRYGHVDDGSGLSMTELEYQQALDGRKPLRIFIMDDDAPIRASMVERDPAKLERLNDFKARVLRNHTCKMFIDESDLAVKVESSFGEAGP